MKFHPGIVPALSLALFGWSMEVSAQERVDREVKPAESVEAKAPIPTSKSITFRARSLEMTNPDWSKGLESRLRTVKKGRSFTIWAADAKVVPELIKRADRVLGFVMSNCAEGEPFTWNELKKTPYVIAGEWMVANGAAAFNPKPAEFEHGLKLSMVGRIVKDGVVVRGSFENIHLDGFESIPVESPLNAFAQAVANIQLPESTFAHDQGDWLIPNDGVLVIHLAIWHDVPIEDADELGDPEDLPVWALVPLELAAAGLDALDLGEWVEKTWEDYSKKRALRRYWESQVREQLLIIAARPIAEADKTVSRGKTSRP
jgi:hypothetical protein